MENRLRFLWQRVQHWPIRQPIALLEASGYLLLVFLWLFFSPAEGPARLFWGNLLIAAPGLTAVLQALIALPSLPKEQRRAWFYLALALLGWALRHLTWIFYGMVRRSAPPILSLADLFGLLAYPFATFGLLLFSRGFRHAPTRFRFLLDLTINSGVIVTFGWLFLRPILDEPIWLQPARLIPVVYPMADLLLLMILVNAFLTGRIPRWTMIILTAAVLSLTLADYAYAFFSLSQSYRSGSLTSLGWIAAYLMIGNEALRQRRAEKKSIPRWRRPLIDFNTQIQNVLPITLVLALDWYVLARWQWQGEFSLFALLMSLLLSIIVIVRLGIRAGEVELQRYWQLFSSLGDPAFICDPEGKFILGNPALAHLINQPEEDDWFGENLKAIFNFPGLAAWPPRQALTLQVTLRADNRPFLLSLSPITTEGRPLVAGVAHDLSQQKEQENAIRQAYAELQSLHHRLEELNAGLEAKVAERTRTLSEAYQRLEEQHRALQELDRLKDDFISMVSHELRTPLNNLGGGLELLLARESASEGTQTTLRLMQAEVRRLSRFVENILDLSALEAGRLALHLVPLSLSVIVEEVLRKREHIPGHERLEIHVSADLPLVLADATALESVMHHLIDNALKYAPTGPVRIEAVTGKKGVRVQVADAGPGIPPEKRRFLFQKFQRLNAHDAQTVYGYGLGLYLSRRLLKAMNSDLAYETSTAGGACFYFVLKVAR
ncbi:MAG: ATP-binding protein [Anaerolineae bacterium]